MEGKLTWSVKQYCFNFEADWPKDSPKALSWDNMGWQGMTWHNSNIGLSKHILGHGMVRGSIFHDVGRDGMPWHGMS